MSDLHELGLTALDEREATETDGGARPLPSGGPISYIPSFPAPLPIPDGPVFDVSWSA